MNRLDGSRLRKQIEGSRSLKKINNIQEGQFVMKFAWIGDNTEIFSKESDPSIGRTFFPSRIESQLVEE